MNSNKSKLSCKRGFTLIELLVVVLIIGILAAVALPQYQVAVGKSRIIKYFPVIKSIITAQEAYYLANGQYVVDLNDLDVTVPANCTEESLDPSDSRHNLFYCGTDVLIDNFSNNTDTVGIVKLKYCPSYANQGEGLCSRYGDVRINFYLLHDADYPNKIRCFGLTDFGKKICKTLPEVETVE